MTKYSFSAAPKRPVSPAPPQQSRPFDLDHQMRLFMVEKRSAGLHQQLSPPPTHSQTPSYNTQKQLPIPPSPPRKLLQLASKSSKRFITPNPGARIVAATATYFNPPNRTVSRTHLRPVPYPSSRTHNYGNIRGPSTSAPSLISPEESKRSPDMRQKRPSSFITPETPNDVFWTALMSPGMVLPPRAWVTPESSPLLPPPRDGRRSAELVIVPPPIHVTSLRRPASSPVKRRGTPQLRTKAGEVFESVLGIYPNTRRHIPARSNPDILTTHMANGISPRRITIDSVDRPPRTPPPPPTPAKSRAQRERARAPAPAPAPPAPSTTPVGYVAELAGSLPPVELMGDVEFPVIMAPVPQKKKRRVKASKVKSKVKQQQRPVIGGPEAPEGKEMYARLPLPEVPTGSTSPTTTAPSRSCGASPVLEVDFDSFDGGLVEWFNNFNWSDVGTQVSPPRTPNSARSTSTTGSKTHTPETGTLRIPPVPGSAPPSARSVTFQHDIRASVVNPDGAVTTCEPSPKLSSFFTISLAGETGLLSPVFPVSPRFASYYGARASFASSVGDAFRFDEGDALSDVDERYEGELDVDELYGFDRDEQFLNEMGGGVEGEDKGEGEGEGEGEYESQEIAPGDRTSLDSRLELEIEMMLNRDYGGGSPDDWRDGIYSAGSSSDASDDWGGEDREGEIVVGLDISTGEDTLWEKDEGRPRTRYIAGRNSAIEGDVVFCLRGVDSM